MLAGGLEWVEPTDPGGLPLYAGDRPDYIIETLGELLPSSDKPRAAARAPGQD